MSCVRAVDDSINAVFQKQASDVDVCVVPSTLVSNGRIVGTKSYRSQKEVKSTLTEVIPGRRAQQKQGNSGSQKIEKLEDDSLEAKLTKSTGC